MKVHRTFKWFCAYEWQIGKHVFQFCYNDKFNWREYATFWRFNYFRAL